MKTAFSVMSNLQNNYCLKIYFKKVDQDTAGVDQDTGGKWLIHGPKHCKDNKLHSLEIPCKIS